jgi:hypothetical protein
MPPYLIQINTGCFNFLSKKHINSNLIFHIGFYKVLVWDSPNYMNITQRFKKLNTRQLELKKIEKTKVDQSSDEPLTIAEK